jgi:hypothetical protein
MAGDTICETGETDENPVVEQIELLTGLTGLPPFPLSLQKADVEAGPNKFHTYSICAQALLYYETRAAGVMTPSRMIM